MEVTMATGALFSLKHSHFTVPKLPSLSSHPKQGLVCQAIRFKGITRISVRNKPSVSDLLNSVSSSISDIIKSAKGKGAEARCKFLGAKGTFGTVGSCPLLPKLVKAIAVGYIIWLGSRYVAFQKSKMELASQLIELKELGHDEFVE